MSRNRPPAQRSFLFWKLLTSALLLLSAYFVYLYIVPPFYEFAPQQPFAGKQIYNPYAQADNHGWIKANLHAHSHRWGGLTNGKVDLETTINTYRTYGYDLIGISNYQDKTEECKDSTGYVPLYERGWGWPKFHLLVFGEAPVRWSYPPFIGSQSYFQYLIESSREGNDLVCIAHPEHTREFSTKLFAQLQGYTHTEIRSGMGDSRTYWDAALSAGRHSFLLMNDDSHNASDIGDIGVYFNYIHAEKADYKSVVKSLKQGLSYGVQLPESWNQSLKMKTVYARTAHRFHTLTLQNDSIRLRLSMKADSILFIGQGGIVKRKSTNTHLANYPFDADDTYIRTEIHFADGVRLFLNPLFRYKGEPLTTISAEQNTWITWGLRTLYIAGLALILLLIKLIWFGRKKKKNQSTRYYGYYSR